MRSPAKADCAIDYQRLFQASPTPHLILSPACLIIAVNDAYLQATMTKREDIVGRLVFDVVPDNPDDPGDPKPSGVRDLSASLSRAMSSHAADIMAVQKYHIRRPPEAGGGFEERWWSISNTPMHDDDGKVIYVIHRVDDVTDFVHLGEEPQTNLAPEDAMGLWRRVEALETELFLRSQERQEIDVRLHEADEALRESESRFHAMADVAPVLMWLAGPDQACIWCNRRWLEFTGRTLAQELGNGWAEGVHPDDAERCWLAYTFALDRREPFGIEYRLRYKDGSYRWIFDQGAPRFDDAGTFLGYIGSAVDVEDHKRLEAELRDSAKRLQRFYDSGLLGVIYWNMQGRVTDANDKFLEMVGYTRDDLRAGQIDWQAMTPPEYRQLDVASVKELLATGVNARPFEKQYIRKDGSRLPVLVAGAMLDETRFHGIAFVLDITVRKTAAAALRQSEQRLRLATEAAKIGAFDWNIRTDAITWTSQMEALYGLAPGEFAGTQEAWEQMLHADDRAGACAKVEEAMQTGEPVEHEWRVIWRDGSVHWLAGRFQASKDAAGRPLRLSGVNLDVTERKEAQERLRTAALHDPLTELPNRALFFEYAAHALAAAARMQTRAALLFVDLDRFKPINDAYGHKVGDAVLKEVARRLVACTRQADLVGRLGGDEFVILLSHLDADSQRESAVVQNVVERISEPIHVGALDLNVTPSVGVAIYPEHGQAVDELIHAADLAMYEAKDGGRAGAKTYRKGLETPAQEAAEREERLRHALETNTLLLYYQPILGLHDENLVAAEALVRMSLDDGRIVGPNMFMPNALASKLGEALDNWVLSAACQQQAIWLGQGLSPLIASLNISPVEARLPGFPDKLRAVLKETGVDPAMVQVEVSEDVLDQTDGVKEFVEQLKLIGVQVALDGFGSGPIKLSHLSDVPFDRIKLEQVLVRQAGAASGISSIPRLLIAMGQILKYNIVWERVESQQTLDALRQSGTGEVQGFLLGRPLPADQFAAWCRGHRQLH